MSTWKYIDRGIVVKSNSIIIVTLQLLVILISNMNQAKAQTQYLDCNKGAAYEVNIQYQYGGKGAITEYKKMFYILENGNDKSKIILFEIIPIEFTTPSFEVGGITTIHNVQYVIGNYCNHQWNDNGIILPQTIHAEQEGGNDGERSQGIINKMRWSSKHSYSGESCPVSLYFYGKDYGNSTATPIKDIGNGIMPFEETSKITSGKNTITRSIRKVEWSDQFSESLYYLATLFNNRFNNAVQKFTLETQIEKAIYRIGDTKLGTLFKDKVGTYVKRSNVISRGLSEDSESNVSDYDFDKPFDINRIYKLESPYPVISNKCFGPHSILYNLNNTINSGNMNIGRLAIWDVYLNGEQNKSADLKQIVNDMQKQLISYTESIKTMSNNISTITTISNKIEGLKNKIDNLDKLLQFNSDPQLPLIFEENSLPGIMKHSEKVIYDKLSLSFRNYTSSDAYTLQFTDTLGIGYTKPRYLESNSYSILQSGNENSTQLINRIKDSIKNIGLLSRYFYESMGSDLSPLKSFVSKPEIKKLIDKIQEITVMNQNGIPSFFESDTYQLIQFPEKECTNNLDNLLYNEVGLFVDYLLSTYKTRRFRLDGKGNDYDIDDSDEYIEKRRKIISPSLLKLCSQDEKYGATIVSNMFFLHASKLPKSIECNMKIIEDIIDDAEVCEILSELFGIDEDDIEDVFESIMKKKTFTLPSFTKRELYSYSVIKKDPNNPKRKSEISESLQTLFDSLQTEKKLMSSNLQVYEKHVKEIDTVIALLAKHVESKTGYISQSSIKFTNIPESNYSSICNFLTEYNVSRGNNSNLFTKGKLLENTVRDLKKVKSDLSSFYYKIGNSNASHVEYGDELITYSPDLNNWIIMNIQDQIYEDKCVGMGQYIGIGFGVAPGKCTIESIFIGGQPLTR
jgi:hypothetical protein